MIEIAERQLPVSPPMALLGNGPHRALAALENGRTLASVLTGADLRANRLLGCERGYFALFQAQDRPDAAALLFERAVALQREWGMQSLFGPVAPDGGGYRAGVMVQGFEARKEPLNAWNPPYYEALLLGCGFQARVEWNGFALDLDALIHRRYIEAGCWAARRGGLRVFEPRLWQGRAQYGRLHAAMELEGRIGLREFARRLDAESGQARGHIWLCERGGEPCGALLAFYDRGEGQLRLATLHVREAYRRTSAALALLGAFVERARELRPTRITASLIDGENAASMALAAGASGRLLGVFRQYECPI